MNLSLCLDILDLPREIATVTFEEAKAAYRLIVQFWHPDRYSHNEKLYIKASDKMKEINAAWGEVESHFKSSNSGGVIARYEQVESRYKQTLKNFEKVVRCPSCMNNSFVSDTRCFGRMCETCRYPLNPKEHDVKIDYETSVLWPMDANIACKPMNRAYASEWLGKCNYRGYSDWRLPTRDEIVHIKITVDQQQIPYHGQTPFRNVQTTYWVAENATSDVAAWCGYHVLGTQNAFDPTGSYHVWPVSDR